MTQAWDASISKEHLWLEANGIRFHALADGPPSGPLVLLLHGFPELSLSWAKQLGPLAAAGYRAVAPDLRGYGQTSRSGPYDLRTLAKDVRGLIQALGRQSAVVVGHDWGGGVAYGAALFEPAVVSKLVILNCPHPKVMADALQANPAQRRRSWYMFFFQLPWVPEWVVSRQRASAVARALRGGSHVREVWTPEALEPYRTAFSDRSSARAAIGYYRAAFRGFWRTRRDPVHRIEVPTLILWGRKDRFLGEDLLAPEKLAPCWSEGNSPTVRFVEDAGHFVQSEAPERVSQELVGWLGPA